MYKSRLAFTVSFWVDEGRFVHCFVPQALPRGPGIWKLNVSVLEEEEFVALVTSFWASWRTKKSPLFFGLSRGVWQGCPLSPVLYVLYAEVVACSIRVNPAIDRLSLPEAPVPLPVISQYANDPFVIVTSDATIGGTFAT